MKLKFRINHIDEELLRIIGFVPYYDIDNKHMWYEYNVELKDGMFSAIIDGGTLKFCQEPATKLQIAEYTYIRDNIDSYLIEDLTFR